ncbi:MAG: hypothetical protein WCM76_11045 [Bacteroidota bacterium]
MKKGRFILLAIGLVAMMLTSCLTVEKKQYTFEFTGKNSGNLTIKYVNIMSIVDSAGYTEVQDFDELVSSYINGSKIEEAYPGATNITKKLFEEDGVLCAEVKMNFPDLASARLYLCDKKGPYGFYASSVDGETYIESNGNYGGDFMPCVFWNTKMKTLTVTTSVSKPTDDTYVSLLQEYVKWKKKN